MLPRAVLLVPEPESTPTALGIIRSLGRVSIPVVAAASNLTTPSFFSRYVKHRLVCPALEFEPINLKDALIQFGKSVDEKPVLYASDDEHVAAIHHYRDEFSQYFHYHFLDKEVLLKSLDKREMYRACNRAGIETGNTLVIDDSASIDRIVDEAFIPSVLKPVRWVSLFDGKPRVIVSSFINLDKRQFPYEHWRNSET